MYLSSSILVLFINNGAHNILNLYSKNHSLLKIESRLCLIKAFISTMLGLFFLGSLFNRPMTLELLIMNFLVAWMLLEGGLIFAFLYVRKGTGNKTITLIPPEFKKITVARNIMSLGVIVFLLNLVVSRSLYSFYLGFQLIAAGVLAGVFIFLFVRFTSD